jgi:hypothetical protein
MCSKKKTAEEIFAKNFKEGMKGGSITAFQKTYPTLYRIIIKSIKDHGK